MYIFFGCLLQGVGPVFMIFFTPSSFWALYGIGMLIGLPAGIYWFSRSLVTAVVTKGKGQIQYLFREQIESTVISVIVPAALAWCFVRWADFTHLLYSVLAIVSACSLLIAGMLAFLVARHISQPKTQKVLVNETPQIWRALRCFALCDGAIIVNETVMSMMLIFFFFGLEDVVGFTKACTALLVAFLMYTLGRFVTPKSVPKIFLLSGILLTMSSLSVAWWWNRGAIAGLIAMMAFVGGVRGVAFMSVVYEAIDRVKKETRNSRVSLFIDREVFLNLGRTTVLFASIFASIFSPITYVRYGLLITALLHFILVLALREIRKPTPSSLSS